MHEDTLRLFATDYDGTLAFEGRVTEATRAALAELRAAGWRLALVTGRILADLQAVYGQTSDFDYIVAENGALLHRPSDGLEQLLAEPPPGAFVEALRALGVAPLEIGRVIVSTREPHEGVVLRVIRELGLELQVTFNKGAVMVLPSGVNKGVALAHVAGLLGIAREAMVAVGDGENDHSLLDAAGVGVAVHSAVPSLIERADVALERGAGAGIVELVARLLTEPGISAPSPETEP